METAIDVIEHSQIAEVRRVVAELARSHGMAEADMARAALVATETASNLVKYGKRGRALVSWFNEGGAEGIQIIGADHGPGFTNFNMSARDGHSTGGSLGIGLGTLLRAANVFDHYSVEAAGAVIFSRITMGGRSAKLVPGQLVIGSRTEPKPGQIQCGDAWASISSGGLQRICVVDGLGHGLLAASASHEAIKAFKASPESDSSADIMLKAHAAMKSTRGAVMAVASIDVRAGTLNFAGIGNIHAGIYVQGQFMRFASTSGIVGYNVRTLRPYEYEWKPGSTLIMSSDGLTTKWSLERMPALFDKHPALVAAALHRDFSRGTDDSTVVVARELT